MYLIFITAIRGFWRLQKISLVAISALFVQSAQSETEIVNKQDTYSVRE